MPGRVLRSGRDMSSRKRRSASSFLQPFDLAQRALRNGVTMVSQDEGSSG
jgi:hypothetical protein